MTQPLEQEIGKKTTDVPDALDPGTTPTLEKRKATTEEKKARREHVTAMLRKAGKVKELLKEKETC